MELYYSEPLYKYKNFELVKHDSKYYLEYEMEYIDIFSNISMNKGQQYFEDATNQIIKKYHLFDNTKVLNEALAIGHDIEKKYQKLDIKKSGEFGDFKIEWNLSSKLLDNCCTDIINKINSFYSSNHLYERDGYEENKKYKFEIEYLIAKFHSIYEVFYINDCIRKNKDANLSLYEISTYDETLPKKLSLLMKDCFYFKSYIELALRYEDDIKQIVPYYISDAWGVIISQFTIFQAWETGNNYFLICKNPNCKTPFIAHKDGTEYCKNISCITERNRIRKNDSLKKKQNAMI